MITTHILDVSRGKPAHDVPVKLELLGDSNVWNTVGEDVTNNDGRVTGFFSSDAGFETGTYRLTFDTASYFSARNIDAFYPQVTVIFVVNDANQHYHVPLLLSPFGFSTYRGS